MKNVPVAKPDDQHADLTEPPDIRHDSWVHLEVDHILKRKLNNVLVTRRLKIPSIVHNSCTRCYFCNSLVLKLLLTLLAIENVKLKNTMGWINSPVSEWGDDQPVGVAEILEAVLEVCVDHHQPHRLTLNLCTAKACQSSDEPSLWRGWTPSRSGRSSLGCLSRLQPI